MRTTLRLIAVIVLVLLGAPVAMHVVMHDLDQDHHDGDHHSFSANEEHGGHEHPIISSAPPTVPACATAMTASLDVATATRLLRVRLSTDERNTVALGAVRIDEDTGPQSLLSTFLI